MNDPSTQASEDQSTNPTSKKNDDCSNNSKGMMMIVYKECLKNHAAALGAHSTDGCGEFMPSSVEDTLLCSACGCHRNFHRKEVDMGGTGHTYLPKCHYWSNYTSSVPTSQLLECHQLPEGAPEMRGPHIIERENVGPTTATPSGNDGKKVKVEEEEMMMKNKKKRHRTRFTNEQKVKMLEFAEKVGWRMQKVNEGLVQQFCQDVGVKKKVLKVWMHNNKPLFAKKTVSNSTPSDHNASDSTN